MPFEITRLPFAAVVQLEAVSPFDFREENNPYTRVCTPFTTRSEGEQRIVKNISYIRV